MARVLLRAIRMFTRSLKSIAPLLGVCGLVGVVDAGCLSRPVATFTPNLNENFTTTVTDQAIDKVDLLFVIDNSASMGDKQAYLSQAVPILITRLVTPNCVDAMGNVLGVSDSGGNGTCTQGTVEFPPVHDMHIGVLSTSLGSRLSGSWGDGSGLLCDPTATVTLTAADCPTCAGVTINNSNDDQGHLLNRSGPTETPLADAGTFNFLYWFPSTAKNMNVTATPATGQPLITSSTTLISDFTSLIQGIGNYGCGIESQLESWYRFLVQPDPYASLSLTGGRAAWTGVDTTILQQRAAFLRPDSLVAIIDMTDENDSEIDVRALDGQGYLWMAANFQPPRGTVACNENATNSGLSDPSTCTSCQLASGAAGDANCQQGDYMNENDWGFNANLRHVHMIQKYGVGPQFPVQRYQIGLSSKVVPDRNGEYPAGASSYQGLTSAGMDCTNPLFAAQLPDGSSTAPAALCNLTQGPRTSDLVFYAHIGGVPHQLLQQDPTNPTSPPKEVLAPSDWVAILGTNPDTEDYTGIDTHMIESYAPRAGLSAGPGGATLLSPDPENGYDWVTDQGDQHVLAVDREYACIFPLTTPRDCTQTMDPNIQYGCDCPATTGLTAQELPPLCNQTTQTQQIGAKAYPTVRELRLAQLMGDQGFISSLCPIDVTPAAGTTETSDPLYGYNPAVNGIVDRLKVALNNQCLPEQLAPDPTCGNVPCLIIAQPNSITSYNGTGACANPPAGACMSAPGLLAPGTPEYPQEVATSFCNAAHNQWVLTTNGTVPKDDPATFPSCAIAQLVPKNAANASCTTVPPVPDTDFANGTCANSPDPGWCYVTGAAAGMCPQAITFTTAPAEPPSGWTASLQCVESALSVVGDAGAGGD